MKALVLASYAEDEESRSSYEECTIIGYDRDKYCDYKTPDFDSIQSTKAGHFRNLDMSFINPRQFASLPITRTDSAGLTYYIRRTKRDVQKEIKEKYKSKTQYLVYIGDGTNNPYSNMSYDYRLTVPTFDKAVKYFHRYTHVDIMQTVEDKRGYSNNQVLHKDPKDEYYCVDSSGKSVISSKRLNKV
ncbi:hypothetical protein XaC1_479 [Xanthomonas phage XaC1]|nr:hypothetical protein XaC1_479 [Xanthomonas phage XaC1]